MQRRSASSSRVARGAQEIAERFGLSGDQAELVERAAERIRRFRPYLSPRLAAHVEREPEPAPLGGQEREVSVLFADLEGFTSYAEGAGRPR